MQTEPGARRADGPDLRHTRRLLSDPRSYRRRRDGYRARDTKLGRDVAIKVLPDFFASDPDRLARFQREAHVLASLNHPHIATVYGLEEVAGQPALAMELVEGPTLAERIDDGTLPVDEALGIARQIAEALDAAHGHGIIHRDLKPLNIKLTPDGSVKLLDFGLAKVADRSSGSGPIALEGPLANSPTATTPAMTAMGVLLGTAAYMSPEQARGRAVDHRADVWAFGCVLYEMLAGRLAFGGSGITEVLGAILHKDPDWTSLPANTPRGIRRLLTRCLQKPLERRLHSLGDAVIEIDDALDPLADERSVLSSSRRWVTLLPWILASASAAALAFSLARTQPEAVPQVSKLAAPLPAPMLDTGRPVIALSPDGDRIGYVAVHGSTSIIYVRPVDGFDAMALPGTEGAFSLFFSPDGEWIGFYAGGRLKKVSIRGGPPVTLATLTDYLGSSWGANGTIISSVSTHQLFAIPEAGGEPKLLALPPGRTTGDVTRGLPHLLPGGRAVLLNVVRVHEPQGSVAVLALESGEEQILVADATHPSYVNGFLVFARSGTLFAVRFDLDRLAVTGTPVPVLEGVRFNQSFATTHYAVSPTGRLAYVPGASAAGRLLAATDRKGVVSTLTDSRRAFYMPRFSPDGQRLALTILDEGAYSIWSMDAARGTLSHLVGASFDPVWSPDGRHIAFATAREGGTDLAIVPSDGSGPVARVLVDSTYKLPTSWSPDGKAIIFTRIEPGSSTGEDIYIVARDGTGLRPVLQSPANETAAVVSPDGKWLAYAGGDLTGSGIYVSAFGDAGRRWRVDADGGYMPAWSPKGRELFFLGGAQRNRLMVVEVERAGDGLQPSKPRLLFEQSMGGGIGFGLRRYDVTPDGQRFVFATAENTGAPKEIRVVLDWRSQIERLLAPK